LNVKKKNQKWIAAFSKHWGTEKPSFDAGRNWRKQQASIGLMYFIIVGAQREIGVGTEPRKIRYQWYRGWYRGTMNETDICARQNVRKKRGPSTSEGVNSKEYSGLAANNRYKESQPGGKCYSGSGVWGKGW